MLAPVASIVIAASASLALFFTVAPSMPLYSVKDIQLDHFHISLFRWMEISAKLFTGMEVHNDNVLGADLYSTHVDIYYPDWYGVLQHIGYLEETERFGKGGDCNPHEEDDRGMCLPDKTTSGRTSTSSTTIIENTITPTPFFSVQSRGMSTSNPGAITVYVQHVSPSTYLNILKHIFLQWGKIDILVSGVAHVKTPLGIPLSLGLVCDNVLDAGRIAFRSQDRRSLKIVGKTCAIEKVSTGWTGILEMAAEVKDRVMEKYSVKGEKLSSNVDHHVQNKDSKYGGPSKAAIVREEDKGSIQQLKKNGLEEFISSSEMILNWHDF